MDNKEKFTNKVDDYVKYRPSYPQTMMEYLANGVGLGKHAVVADVGAGTGIFTKQLAGIAGKILAVEPNRNMRAACIQHCNGLSNVTAVDGCAEDTGLPDHSVAFITVAQAFHWFDRRKTLQEFQRILTPGGKVILLWNSRVPESAVVQENDELCRRLCPDFKGFSGCSDVSVEAFGDFFRDGYCEYSVFENNRILNSEGYIGSSLSSSYAPGPKDENYKPFIDGLTALFEKFSKDGILILPNVTRCYVGAV